MTHGDEAAYDPRLPGLHRPTAHAARTSGAGLRGLWNAAEPMPTPMRAPANNARRAPGTSETHSRRGAPGTLLAPNEPRRRIVRRGPTSSAETTTSGPRRQDDAGPGRAPALAPEPCPPPAPGTGRRHMPDDLFILVPAPPPGTGPHPHPPRNHQPAPRDPDERRPEQPHPPRPHNTKNRKGAVTPWDPSGRILRIPGAASGALTPREPSTSPGGHAGSGHRARPAPHRAGL